MNPRDAILEQLARRIEDRPPPYVPFGEWCQDASPELTWTPPHLVHLSRHLDAVTLGEVKHLMVAMPPRHGKSATVSERYVAYRVERDPTCRVILCSYAEALAATFSRGARRIVLARGGLGKEARARAEWATPGGGGVRAAGRGGGITGRGGHLVVLDDVLKGRAEAESRAVRDECWQWYSHDVYPRLEPGGSIVLVNTRYHEDDLAGRILNGPGAQDWTVVELRALAEEGDKLGRPVGEALWPERYDKAALEAIREVEGEYGFQAQYQQRPTRREGAMFKAGLLDIVDVAPAGLPAVRSWDLAASGGDDDWTVGVKLAGPDSLKRYYVLDVVRGRWEAAERNAVIRQTAKTDGTEVPVTVPQDPGAGGKEAAQYLVAQLAGYAVSAHPVSGDKALRAEPLAAQVNAGNVALVRAAWCRDLIDEFSTFPRGAHDDQVDAAADAFNALARRRGAILYVA